MVSGSVPVEWTALGPQRSLIGADVVGCTGLRESAGREGPRSIEDCSAEGKGDEEQ